MKFQVSPILAAILGLVTTIVGVTNTTIWYRFFRRAYLNRCIDPHDQKRTAWQIFWLTCGMGACLGIAAIVFSFDPSDADLLTLGNVLRVFLIVIGSFSGFSMLAFFSTCKTAKILYEKKNDQEKRKER